MVRNSYVCGLVFLRFGSRNSYVCGLVLLRFGVRNSYVCVLDFDTFGGKGFLCWGASFLSSGG